MPRLASNSSFMDTSVSEKIPAKALGKWGSGSCLRLWVLLAISREFGKSVDWLLTGKIHVEPKKRVAKDPPTLG
jgi:hypothetical protein